MALMFWFRDLGIEGFRVKELGALGLGALSPKRGHPGCVLLSFSEP